VSSSLRGKLALSEPLGTLLLLVLAVACAALLFVQERATAPRELPSLTLPAAAVQQVLRADAHAARTAPSSPRARALEALLIEHGRLEAQGLEEVQRYQDRRRALAQGYRELVAQSGPTAALRLREKAVLELEAALGLRLSDARGKAVLGSFAAVLAREGASRDGDIVAPHFVVRTLYKARWNILHGLTRDHAFTAVEKRAYYGWQALHAERISIKQRIEALHAYGLAGGEDLEEALGVLLLRQGDSTQAVRALEHAHRAHGGLRLRNALIAARQPAKDAE
jgi:hypothetical protein